MSVRKGLIPTRLFTLKNRRRTNKKERPLPPNDEWLFLMTQVKKCICYSKNNNDIKTFSELNTLYLQKKNIEFLPYPTSRTPELKSGA